MFPSLDVLEEHAYRGEGGPTLEVNLGVKEGFRVVVYVATCTRSWCSLSDVLFDVLGMPPGSWVL